MSFDKEAFLGLIEGDKELFENLLKLFEDDSPKLIAKIRFSLKNKLGKDLEEAAHRLKGNLRNFYAFEASQLSQKLERAGHNGEFEGKLNLIDELEEKLNILIKELNEFLKEIQNK